MGKLPPEHCLPRVRATAATDETQSQLSSIQPPSHQDGYTPGGHAAFPDDADRHAPAITNATPFDTPPPPPIAVRDSHESNNAIEYPQTPLIHSSRHGSVTSTSSPHNAPGTLRRGNTTTSSSSSLPGLLKSIRTWGNSTSGSVRTDGQAVGGGQKQYPLSSRFYTMDSRIGKGASATVWRAKCVLFDETVAIKVINLDKEDIDVTCFVHEAGAMAAMHHPYIIPLYASFIEHNKLWMVQPFVDGGDLYEIMQKAYPKGLPDTWIAIIMRHCLEALAYIHAQGYVHRDIKAANVLIDHNGHIFLADFTIATQLERSFDASTVEVIKADGFTGTIAWMAPEIVEGLGADAKSDIWSLGMTVVELACGRNPWLELPFDKVMFKVLHGDPPELQEGPLITQHCLSFVEKCLQKDPDQRPSAAELLKHPFVRHVADESVLGDNLVPHIATTQTRTKELHDPLVGRYYRQLRKRVETDRAQRAASLVQSDSGRTSAQDLLSMEHHRGHQHNTAFVEARNSVSSRNRESSGRGGNNKGHQGVRWASSEPHLTPKSSSTSGMSLQRSSTLSRLSNSLGRFGRMLSSRKSSRLNFEWDFSPAADRGGEGREGGSSVNVGQASTGQVNAEGGGQVSADEMAQRVSGESEVVGAGVVGAEEQGGDGGGVSNTDTLQLGSIVENGHNTAGAHSTAGTHIKEAPIATNGATTHGVPTNTAVAHGVFTHGVS